MKYKKYEIFAWVCRKNRKGFFCPVIDYSLRNKLSTIFKQGLKRHYFEIVVVHFKLNIATMK